MILVPIDTHDRPALEAFLDEYLAELARYRERPVGATSAAEYTYLDLYWTEPRRHCHFLVQGTERVGFVLFRRSDNGGTMEMAEFYVCPAARRTGVGAKAVSEVWRQFPGSWELQVHAGNEAAKMFWKKCVEEEAYGSVSTADIESADGARIEFNFEIRAV